MSRERCQGDMGDSDYTERAFRAYFRAGANIQPSASSSGLRSHEGRDYVVLENCNGILAEQEIRIGEMEWRGEDTRIAREVLQAQWEALTQVRWHRRLIRRLIRDEIARLSPGSNAGAFRCGTSPQNEGHPRPDRRQRH